MVASSRRLGARAFRKQKAVPSKRKRARSSDSFLGIGIPMDLVCSLKTSEVGSMLGPVTWLASA